MSNPVFNRRFHDRFVTPPMYTRVVAHRVFMGRMQFLEGHVYDISAGGVRIELDEPLTQGETVNLEVHLPVHLTGDEGLPIQMTCRVVRVFDDLDDPGPVRSALQVVRFGSQEDRDRLMTCLGSGQLLRAA